MTHLAIWRSKSLTAKKQLLDDCWDLGDPEDWSYATEILTIRCLKNSLTGWVDVRSGDMSVSGNKVYFQIALWGIHDD